MKNTTKIMLMLAMVFGMASFGFSQLNGEQNRAISLAKQAASDCVNRSEYAGLTVNYDLTETMICDFTQGPTGNAAIFGYRVEITAVGRCPHDLACLPVFYHVATVYISCGNQEVLEVICN